MDELMYQSQEYLEIGGKLITCPYSEDEYLHGVNLRQLLCHLHDSGASDVSEFQSIILTTIETKTNLTDMDKISDIFNHIIADLRQLGVIQQRCSH